MQDSKNGICLDNDAQIADNMQWTKLNPWNVLSKTVSPSYIGRAVAAQTSFENNIPHNLNSICGRQSDIISGSGPISEPSFMALSLAFFTVHFWYGRTCIELSQNGKRFQNQKSGYREITSGT